MSEETKACIACAEEIKKNARLCRYCKTAQDDADFLGSSIPTAAAMENTEPSSSAEASSISSESPQLQSAPLPERKKVRLGCLGWTAVIVLAPVIIGGLAVVIEQAQEDRERAAKIEEMTITPNPVAESDDPPAETEPEPASVEISAECTSAFESAASVPLSRDNNAEVAATGNACGSVDEWWQAVKENPNAFGATEYPDDEQWIYLVTLCGVAEGSAVCRDAEAFLAEARHAGVLAMEAMWTRYLPMSSVLRQLMDRGDLGAPEFLQVNFGNDNRHIPRLWTPGSGGIVHDMGIYPITFAQFVLGNPTGIVASGSVNSDGMDEETFVTLHYDSGARAQLYISGVATVPCTAAISFEKKMVAIDHPFFVPTGLSVNAKDLYFTGEHWADTSPVQGHDGLSYQATSFAHYIAEGRIESPLHTHADVVANIRVAEEICELTGAHPWG